MSTSEISAPTLSYYILTCSSTTYICDVGYGGRYSHKPHGEACVWILCHPVGVNGLHPAHHHLQSGTTGCVLHHMHLEEQYLPNNT